MRGIWGHAWGHAWGNVWGNVRRTCPHGLDPRTLTIDSQGYSQSTVRVTVTATATVTVTKPVVVQVRVISMLFTLLNLVQVRVMGWR